MPTRRAPPSHTAGRARGGAMHTVRPMVFRTLDEARRAVAGLGADGRRIELMAAKCVHRCVYVPELPVRAAVILKQEMLAKGGEAALPWEALCLRGETTAVLLCGTLRQYANVCLTLREQPFGLPDLAARLEECLRRSTGDDAPRSLRIGTSTWPLGQRTYVMGIVNMTPDSFSGDGLAPDGPDVARALAQAQQMHADGADIIDVGGESTRPGAEAVDADEQARRIVPLVRELAALRIPVSVDTRAAKVAAAAIAVGASLVNDVTALTGDPDMRRVCAEAGVAVCLMHMQGSPADMQTDPAYGADVVLEVAELLERQVETARAADVAADAILVDPGIGFGKTVDHNLELLQRLDELRAITAQPVLVGTSRKSLIGKVLGLPVDDRIEGTAATVACAIARGADMVRVHDVREMTRVCRMTDAVLRREVRIASSSRG